MSRSPSRFYLVLFLATFATAAQRLTCEVSPVADCLPGADCSTVEGMVPPVQRIALSESSVTSRLSSEDQSAFEHLLGQALASTSAAQWATREFAQRMRRVIVGAARFNGTSAEEALVKAFVPPRCVQPDDSASRRRISLCCLREFLLVLTLPLAVSTRGIPAGSGHRLMPLKLCFREATFVKFGRWYMR